MAGHVDARDGSDESDGSDDGKKRLGTALTDITAITVITLLLHRPRHLDTREAFDLIAHAHIVVVLNRDAALGAGASRQPPLGL
jgi:hypothetical protein